MRGGYKVIDFKNAELTSGTEATIKGAYEAAANPYGKATVISGLNVGGTSYPEFYAAFADVSGTYTAAVTIGEAVITIEIAEGDAVTVTIAE